MDSLPSPSLRSREKTSRRFEVGESVRAMRVAKERVNVSSMMARKIVARHVGYMDKSVHIWRILSQGSEEWTAMERR